MKTVNVSLGKRSYPIYIGENLLTQSGKFFTRHKVTNTIVIITDKKVASLYLHTVEQSLRKNGFRVFSIVIPSGEKQKSLQTAYTIFTKLLQWNIERKSTIVALGGGVIGDLAGFVAATYQRGVDFVQIPTTLLAQVDSSVGGKTGVNHHLAKNMIGAFYQPKFVLADISVLKTLPKREIICGLGEVVKYGIIMNKKFFNFTAKNISSLLSHNLLAQHKASSIVASFQRKLESKNWMPAYAGMTNNPQLVVKKLNTELLTRFIAESCAMKSYVVSHDEKESGLRAILNFGHTVGHALEQAGNYKTLKHGEAVLYGMLAEADIAVQMKLLSESERAIIENLISQIPLPKLSKNILRVSQLLDSMKKDKKSTARAIRMVLPKKIGKTTLPISVDEHIIINSLQRLI